MSNAQTIDQELKWLSAVMQARGLISFEKKENHPHPALVSPPDIDGDQSNYASTIRTFNMSHAERLIMILSLVPHVRPELLDFLMLNNAATNNPYTQLGGKKSVNGGYLPTGETAVFILAGDDLQTRFELLDCFDEHHFFVKHNILKLQQVQPLEPKLSGLLTISDEYLAYLTTGKNFKPDFSNAFPAKAFSTKLNWDDLVVSDEISKDLDEIKSWLKHGNTILNEWGFGNKIKPGFRVLFSGPPGTGKTLTAALLGKSAHVDVYRVDLSMVVSKYIGETEKNLANVFDMAENKNWILFFDEADALFGKRTATSSSNDRHANQEVSYLLQRIEDYPGLIILATNFKNNIDEAFARRFQVIIDFQKPDEHQRLILWQHAFTPPVTLAPEVDLEKLAADHQLTGANIMNVLRFCSLKVLARKQTQITLAEILQGINKELRKEGKTVFQ